jgi:hypothetical protein
MIRDTLGCGKVEPVRTQDGIYRWRAVNTESVLKVARTIFPFVIVKYKQLELMIGFCEMMQANRGSRDEQYRRAKADIRLKIRELNHS